MSLNRIDHFCSNNRDIYSLDGKKQVLHSKITESKVSKWQHSVNFNDKLFQMVLPMSWGKEKSKQTRRLSVTVQRKSLSTCSFTLEPPVNRGGRPFHTPPTPLPQTHTCAITIFVDMMEQKKKHRLETRRGT